MFDLKKSLIESGIFDENWYCEKYKDVKLSNIEPLDHYVRFGFIMGRDPGPQFNLQFYREQNPDVIDAGVNPLQHFIQYGQREGRLGSPATNPSGLAGPQHQTATGDGHPHRWRHAADTFALRGLLPCAPVAIVINDPTANDWSALLSRVEALPDSSWNGIDIFVLGAVATLECRTLPPTVRSITHLGDSDAPGEGWRFARFAASGAADAYEALLWVTSEVSGWRNDLERALASLPDLHTDPDWGCIGAAVGPLASGTDEQILSTIKIALKRLGLDLRDDRVQIATGAAVWVRPFLLRGLGPSLRPFGPKEVDSAPFTRRSCVLGVLAQLAAESGMNLRRLADSRPSIPATMAEHPVKAVAFYLPQFHPIPENDTWWGKGFTEWSNVTRGKPLFRYHYQPRIPADLGYYDLRLEEIQVAQAQFARDFGIHGFCYYYYWFNGRKLLNQPIEQMFRSSRIDTGFCICWANENWSRNWDGQNRHILIKQEYSIESNLALIHEIIPMMKDPRWIRYQGKPVMVVYRISIIPEWLETARLWREACRKAGVGEIHLCAVRFGLETLKGHPEDHGLDAYVLFPPHEAAREDLRGTMLDLHKDFKGEIYRYSAVIDGDIQRYEDGYTWPTHRGTMLAWDNTARRLTDARIFHGATPYGFRRWMQALLTQDVRHNRGSETLLFINAWNEWAEGTYLEPDQRWGAANLTAVRTAIAAVPGARAVMLPEGVAALPKLPARLQAAGDPLDTAGNGPDFPRWRPGHRAHRPGEPTIMLCAHIAGHHLFGGERSLLDVAAALAELPVNLIVTLPSGGNKQYLDLVDRHCTGSYILKYPQWMQDRPAHGWLTTTFADIMARHQVTVLHANTIVLLEPLEAARRMGVTTVIHVRELISLDDPLRQAIGLEAGEIVARVLDRADWLICNSHCTASLYSKGDRTIYVPNAVNVDALAVKANKFGSTIKFGIVSSNIPKKGLADFVEVARRAAERVPQARFVVIGPENDQTQQWAAEVHSGQRPGNLSFLGYRDTPRAAMVELNVLLNLSNFGESFGRTVAEAMACCRAVIAYDWGALPELVQHGETGFLVPFRDIDGVVSAVETLCANPERILEMGLAGRAVVTDRFSHAELTRALVQGYNRILADIAMPATAANRRSAATAVPASIPRTTIIIPVYNAPDEAQACIASVLKHTDTVRNPVLVINDGSPDPAVRQMLDAFDGAAGLSIRHNDRNIGYTRTINSGLAAAPDDDVVLLNADTVVTPRWLEGLRAAAYCRSQIATVTAMSDNAGAFSFPNFNEACPKPQHLSHEEYAVLMTQATQHCMPPEVPTGSGFCLYIRRAVIDACGAFDENAFPRGYGEENDFCMRALKAGWTHLVSPWSFVFHVRTASFKGEKGALVKAGVDTVTKRYPEYAALVKVAFASGEMTALREAVAAARAAGSVAA